MWLMIASLNMALAVVLGAFGAHGLKNMATAQQLAWWATATDYFFYHALGLLALAVLHKINSLFPIKASFICIQLGIVLFCGSLYIMGVGATSSLGMITPIGGLFMIIGWLLLAFNALKYRKM
ncbi:DUF423 domain-containing protein [Moraxella sp. ZY210820]|uniref:DUF423 domain-containing protein n=1 Tax=unclassified Moraxella TaxID=2685852 RepID=UPI002732029D|nr:DUF423 domain-containing protein [Moraxella sp. ZY210820]WLF84967.1 DUF423 domain-containing protein [Moraxella sp. ZY210820]